MKIRKLVQIDCSKEELWSWLTEFEKIKKWNSTIVKQEQVSQGETKEGFKTKVLIKEGRTSHWYNNEIMTYRPNEILQLVLSGGNLGKNPMFVEYLIKEKNNKIELSLSSQWRPSGFILKLLYPLIKIKAAKNTEEVLQELKKQIEK